MPSEPRVVILCPRRAGFEDRDRIWGFVRAWWARDHPNWRIWESDGAAGPFNRSQAINRAAALAGDWDVAICIDGDVLIAAEPVRQAVDIAHKTGRPTLAYHEWLNLSPQATLKVLGGFRGSWAQRGWVTKTRYDSCSAAMVVRRDLWDAVGGFDELFVGWGYEDIAFRCALETVADCELVKVAATLHHLHHVVSSGNNKHEPTFVANGERGERYRLARFDQAAMAVLLDEAGKARTPLPAPVPSPTRIPRILHRTVPAETTDEVEAWWEAFGKLHPTWDLRTYRDPLDPADWPMTGDLFARCENGAQLAGLVRLEALYTHGGVYVDSDCAPGAGPIPDALLEVPCFALWEDRRVVPDAVMGSEPRHPAFAEMIGLARDAVRKKRGAWESGPGVTTKVLPGRSDVLLLPPGAAYPVHYSVKEQLAKYDPEPWTFAIHTWAASWLPAKAAGG